MDSRKRKAIMNDGMEYVVYISEDGKTVEVYSDDKEGAQFYGTLRLDGDEISSAVGAGLYARKEKVGVLV
jgi:hypothetical protein